MALAASFACAPTDQHIFGRRSSIASACGSLAPDLPRIASTGRSIPEKRPAPPLPSHPIPAGFCSPAALHHTPHPHHTTNHIHYGITATRVIPAKASLTAFVRLVEIHGECCAATLLEVLAFYPRFTFSHRLCDPSPRSLGWLRYVSWRGLLTSCFLSSPILSRSIPTIDLDDVYAPTICSVSPLGRRTR